MRAAGEPSPAFKAKYIRAVSTKAELKRVRSLHQKKYREEEGVFLVQGIKLVQELLASAWEVEAVHCTQPIAERLQHPAVQVWPVHDLERMGTLEHGNEVIAVVRKPMPAAPQPLAHDELVLALDGIADPGNLGTLLRIADWFGVRRIWCSADTVDEFNPKCIQASMGSFLRVTVVRGDLASRLEEARGSGVALYTASMEGASVFDVRLQRPAILVLGSESHGVSQGVRALGATTIAVPRAGAAESLNVATAASALCMEFLRQVRNP